MLFCSIEIIYYSDFIKFAYEDCTNIYRNHEKLNTLYIYGFLHILTVIFAWEKCRLQRKRYKSFCCMLK